MPDAALTFSDLTLGYADHLELNHYSGLVPEGLLTAIAGAIGSGKSTLIKGIEGRLAPMTGTCAMSAGTRVAYAPPHILPTA